MRPCCITHRAHARFIPPCLFPSVQVKVHDIATFNHHNFAFHAARAPSESLKQLAFAFNLQRRMYFLHCTNLQLQRVPAVSQKKSPFRDLVIFTQPLSPDIPLSLKLSDGRWSFLLLDLKRIDVSSDETLKFANSGSKKQPSESESACISKHA